MKLTSSAMMILSLQLAAGLVISFWTKLHVKSIYFLSLQNRSSLEKEAMLAGGGVKSFLLAAALKCAANIYTRQIPHCYGGQQNNCFIVVSL